MNNYLEIIEKALLKYIEREEGSENKLVDSIKYSLMAKGKRVRPIILLEFCRICGGDIKDAIPFACALEMIHTYSLIHDDLPCMDDDDMRRGKPSNHIVYGEDIAVLAGDSLLNLSFETMLNGDAIKSLPADRVLKAAGTLARYSGIHGMIGGQFIDIKNEGKAVDLDVLKEMDLKKTAALICAAAEMGCIIAGADKNKINAAREYGESLGLAFQIMDDILDQTSTTEILGKPVGSDVDNHKSTYVSLLGLNECKKLVNRLTDKSISSLSQFKEDTAYLKSLALSLAKRRS